MFYVKFINRIGQNLPLCSHYIILSASVPGNLSDTKTGFMKFDKWYKLPKTAWKLYWRMQKFKGNNNGN